MRRCPMMRALNRHLEARVRPVAEGQALGTPQVSAGSMTEGPQLLSAAECFIAQMRICDPRVSIVRDGHEPNEAEEQRPCRVPIEPVHVIPPPKDRREQEGYQHSAKRVPKDSVPFAMR